MHDQANFLTDFKKLEGLEYSKSKLGSNVTEIEGLVDFLNLKINSSENAEMRAAIVGKVLGKLKAKADDMKAELEAYCVRTANKEIMKQLEVGREEKKNLEDKIKDFLDQSGGGKQFIHEVNRWKERIKAKAPRSERRLEEENILEQATEVQKKIRIKKLEIVKIKFAEKATGDRTSDNVEAEVNIKTKVKVEETKGKS